MGKKNPSEKGKVYIVQDILDTKLSNGVQFYKVKWKGYSSSDSTWEPQKSFNCSKKILNQFLQARAQKQQKFKAKLNQIEKQRSIIQTEKTKKVMQNSTKSKQQQEECSESEQIQQSDEKIIQKEDLKVNKNKESERITKDCKIAEIESQNMVKQQKRNSQDKMQVKIPKIFKIISVKKQKNNLVFVVDQNGVIKIMSKEQMHTNHLLELCLFYEKHLSFQD